MNEAICCHCHKTVELDPKSLDYIVTVGDENSVTWVRCRPCQGGKPE